MSENRATVLGWWLDGEGWDDFVRGWQRELCVWVCFLMVLLVFDLLHRLCLFFVFRLFEVLKTEGSNWHAPFFVYLMNWTLPNLLHFMTKLKEGFRLFVGLVELQVLSAMFLCLIGLKATETQHQTLVCPPMSNTKVVGVGLLQYCLTLIDLWRFGNGSAWWSFPNDFCARKIQQVQNLNIVMLHTRWC